MSMMRSLEKTNSDPTPEDIYELPKFLEKTANSEKLNTKKKAILEETEDELEIEHVGNSDKTKKDEGLGESLDQHSEMSDSGSSLNSRVVNGGASSGGVMNPVYESVPEEHVAEVGSVRSENAGNVGEGAVSEVKVGDVNVNVNNGNQSEITLDPSKLTYDPGDLGGDVGNWKDSSGVSDSNSSDDLNVFSKKSGSIKKVSFFNNGEDEEEGENLSDPVSDTYVYDGKPRSRFGLGRLINK